MSHKRGTVCEITSFRVENPPSDGVTGPHVWMAIATAHVYDANVDTKGVLTPAGAVLSGAVMRVIEGRVSAATEEEALVGALTALLFQLRATGLSEAAT